MMTGKEGFPSSYKPPSNFKIPKKKISDLQQSPDVDHQLQVLANSYYNQSSSESHGLYNHPQSDSMSATGPSYQSIPSQEEIVQKIHCVLRDYKEKPKQYDPKRILRQTIPDVDDESLPKELTLMFQPLYCKLCAMQLNSNSMAKLHYKSKNHEKKIKKFLVEYAEKTGTPLHKRALGTSASKNEEDTDPRYFYCEVCDLPLTGKLHAESHYMGKNHHKALMGYKAPAGKGHYDAAGKWIRQKSLPKAILPQGCDDSFGLDFKRPKLEIDSGIASPKNEPESEIISAGPSRNVYCTICKVATPTEEQMQNHYKGQKHQKKLRQLNLAEEASSGIPLATDGAHTFSPNRTPSGSYYCKTCNMSLNSKTQFNQHMQSKGHLKKAATM